MSQLVGKPEMAGELREYLEQQAAKGHEWVVYDTDNPINTRYDLHCFPDEEEAFDFEREYQQLFNWHQAVPIGDMIFNLKELEQASRGIAVNNPDLVLKTIKAMNKNNLDDLKNELKELRFPKKVIEEMEKHMEKNLSEFQLRHQQPGDKGQVDMLLHFRQSAQSDYYYFNKYNITLNNAKPLAEGHQYLVISPGEKDKQMMRRFDTPHEAIAYFKEQKGSSELAVGKIDKKELAFKTTLATMENDKVNFVSKDFSKVFYTPAVTQTVYVEKGKGFTAEQSANMLQGRAVHRDDMLNLGGQTYKAWLELDFKSPKDRFNNYKTKQYHDPSYGFDLQKTLDRYHIKELADPGKREKLEETIRNGNRPFVTVVKNGEEVKMRVVAAPRYGELNFHAENGRPEKREQFMTPKAHEQLLAKNKGKEKELAESQGISI
ncbi:hypothetical protein GCM10022216_02340 [Sphingobacterium kyonggiense]|uniref:DUF3945 domain-containing protein n=1 Tax=Sphingobacterium kyonggiense TaxID=714075 RepID=A0ABP7Y805_9SPHI